MNSFSSLQHNSRRSTYFLGCSVLLWQELTTTKEELIIEKNSITQNKQYKTKPYFLASVFMNVLTIRDSVLFSAQNCLSTAKIFHKPSGYFIFWQETKKPQENFPKGNGKLDLPVFTHHHTREVSHASGKWPEHKMENNQRFKVLNIINSLRSHHRIIRCWPMIYTLPT